MSGQEPQGPDVARFSNLQVVDHQGIVGDAFDVGSSIVLMDATMRQVSAPTYVDRAATGIHQVRFLSAVTDLTNGKVLMA